MLKWIFRIIILLLVLFVLMLIYEAMKSQKMDHLYMNQAPLNKSSNTDLQRIAFGSCNKQGEPQDYWELVASHQPDQWLWLGDNVYADYEDPKQIEAAYEEQLAVPAYQKFVDQVDVYGIYDDHDYGLNDGGKEWPIKADAKRLMLDFLKVPEDDASRSREGGYQSYLLGEEERQLRLILLDTRYFRDELERNKEDANQRYYVNNSGDILGEAQWSWLENILANNSARATIIVSSIQVLASDHGFEKWALFPKAKQRLLALLQKYKPENLLLLSGDRHIGEAAHAFVNKSEDGPFTLDKAAANEDAFEVSELTSSGLTHSYEKANEENSLRVSPLVGQRNFGLLTIDWSDLQNPLLFVQLLSAENNKEFFRIAIQSGQFLEDATAYDFTGKGAVEMKPCPQSPNCVSTKTDQLDKKMEALQYSSTLSEAKEQLSAIINELPKTELLESSSNYLHFKFTTSPIPFVDDVEFFFDDASKSIHFRSASRVGYSDMGENAKRMKMIVERWNQAQGN